MYDLMQRVGADCILQFESLPFHSRSLAAKHAVVRLLRQTELLSEYARVLTEAMDKVSVVTLSAVDSSRSISASSVMDSPWLSWQASLLGVDLDQLRVMELVKKNGKTTSAFLYQRVRDCTRGFVLTMGGNTFPGAEKRETIARALRGN